MEPPAGPLPTSASIASSTSSAASSTTSSPSPSASATSSTTATPLQRGLCLKELKQTELALALFRQVAELHPRMPALRKLRQWMSSAELAEKLQKQRAAPPHATDSS